MGNSGLDILYRQRQILLLNFLYTKPRIEEFQDIPDRNSRPSNKGLVASTHDADQSCQ